LWLIAGALPTGGAETAADTILGSLIKETTGRPISNLTAAKNGPAARGHFNLRNGYCSPVQLSGNTWNQTAYSILYPLSSTNPPPQIQPMPYSCVVMSPYSDEHQRGGRLVGWRLDERVAQEKALRSPCADIARPMRAAEVAAGSNSRATSGEPASPASGRVRPSGRRAHAKTIAARCDLHNGRRRGRCEAAQGGRRLTIGLGIVVRV
jgi:hypothetical protein